MNEDDKTKKHIITIAGKPGSGKSSSAKAIATQLGYQHFSSGDLMRALGKERGIDDIHQVNLAAEKGLNVDELVDQRLRDIGNTEEQVVIDSRMAWHWMPDAFKVYLDLDLLTAAKRILDDIDDFRRAHEHIPESPEEYAGVLEKRLASEARRYRSMYDVNPFDLTNYDLVIDTAEHSQAEVIEMIITSYTEWLQTKSDLD